VADAATERAAGHVMGGAGGQAAAPDSDDQEAAQVMNNCTL
jgi:hypothetical protein